MDPRGRPAGAHPRGRPLLFWLVCVLITLIALGRGPASLVSDYQAKKALSTGDYAVATRWLDRAAFFNPALAQVSYYHIQRGQAWYFLHPGHESDDEHVYLGSVYRLQGNDVGAYQELLTVQYMQPTPPYWFTTEMDLTLTHLAETIQRQNGPPIQRINFDATVLPWLQALIQTDASNVYAHYLLGRIAYDLHDYDTCLAQMASVLQFSTNNDVQSSAYTYKALSLSGQGKLAEARATLLQAEEKDPGYLNNIAREELSGLH